MKIHFGPYPKSNKKKRKVKIQIDNYDLWDMHSTLTMIILPMLQRLKNAKKGAPCADDWDVPANIRSYNDKKKKESWHIDKFWFKRWDWVIDEMIWSFEQLNQGDSTYQDLHNQKYIWVETSESLHNNRPEKLFERVHLTKKLKAMLEPNLDMFCHEHYSKKVRNGLRLFAKYYSCLWT